MKSQSVRVHNETEASVALSKTPWVKPVVEILALESAEGGVSLTRGDAGGSHFSRPRS
jgi:hypothetical protein